MVCTGNICRSPLIERMLQRGLDHNWGRKAVDVRSAGTRAMVGDPIEPNALSELAAMGGTGDGFAARQLTREMIAEADLVLTAAREHRAAVARLYPRSLRYVFTLLDFGDIVGRCPPDQWPPQTEDAQSWMRAVTATVAERRGLHPPLVAQQADIPDPYRRSPATYRQVSTVISAAVPGILTALTAGRS